jgi:hypothetical protein
MPVDVADPEELLAEFGPRELVTVVVDVTAPERQLVVRAAYPTNPAIVHQLTRAGMCLWSGVDHAAWTDHGWLDIKALDGEPMARSHP